MSPLPLDDKLFTTAVGEVPTEEEIARIEAAVVESLTEAISTTVLPPLVRARVIRRYRCERQPDGTLQATIMGQGTVIDGGEDAEGFWIDVAHDEPEMVVEIAFKVGRRIEGSESTLGYGRAE